MIVEMEYFDNGTNVGVRSIPTATTIGEAFISGENVIFHVPDGYTDFREAYVALIMYEGPHIIDGTQCNPNFVIPGFGTLTTVVDIYESSLSAFGNFGIETDSNDKVCFMTGTSEVI